TALASAGLGVMHTRWRGDARRVALVQAALIALAYAAAFWLRRRDVFTGMYVQGLLAFFTLRHISLMVTAHRSGPPALADCAAYLAFYPGIMGFFGAPEVYDEFARRNLARPAGLQHRAAARRIAEGVGLVVLAQAMVISVARVEASATALEAWACAIALFLRSALLVLGSWRLVDGAALFYGVRLRVNFTGLLTCRNPSELWWSWRGTLTNWLVQHVYGPLGGGRRHPSFNILATFFVSFVWHAVGVPFLSPEFHPLYLAPVALWAAINTVAVLSHATLTRRQWHPVAALLPDRVRIAGQVVLVWALGSLNPLLLAYQGPSAERLPDLLRLLLGLR
ncbi:MAG: MBOAT family O-acyltransferase, partial [Candidatus Binatia bacterium]